MGEEAAGRRRWDVLFCLSLANLAMIDVWGVLLYASATDRYYLPHYGGVHHAAALLLLVSLAAFAFGWLSLARRTRLATLGGLGVVACALALIAPLEYLRENLGITRSEILHGVGTLPGFAQVAVGAMAATGVVFAARHRHPLARIGWIAVLLMSPLALSNAVQCAWLGLRAPQTSPIPPAEAPERDAPERRVVWILFDELDYRLAFPSRPASVALPELDRLRQESFFASNVREASGHTGKAIPALLLGREVTGAVPTAASSLELRLGDDVGVSLAAQETFFGRLSARGLRSDITGIYHPYCRLFAGAYRKCHWDPFLPGGGLRAGDGFTDVFLSLAFKLVPLHHRGEHIASIRRTVAAASRMAADPGPSVAFLHLPVPHSPHVWDADRQRFSLFRFGDDAYLEQLTLVDRALGEIRRAMEASGTWVRSAVLVTSDHGWRYAERHGAERDHRVPFLLKLPAQRRAFAYDRPFAAWRAQEILLAILDDEIRTPEDVARHLERGSALAAAP